MPCAALPRWWIAFVLPAAVAAAPAAAATTGGGLPPPECVEQLRKARIEQARLDASSARRRAEAAVGIPGCELPALAELVRLLREGALPADQGGALRRRLAERLADPAVELPPGIATYLASLRGSVADDELLLAAFSSRSERAGSAGAELPRAVRLELLEVRARLEERLGRRREALATVDRLTALQGTEANRWRGLELAVDLEEWEDVARRSEALLTASAASAERVRPLYVRTLARLGRYEEMLRQIDLLTPAGIEPRAMSIQGTGEVPGDPEAGAFVALLLDSAWALRDAGRDPEAERIFRRVLDYDPDQESARLAVLNLYASAEERAEQASAVAERRAQERDPQALFEEGSALLAAGDAATATDLLARAAPRLGGTTMAEAAWYNLGLAAYKTERWKQAEEAFAAASRLNPERPESYFQRGLALVRLERCAEAAPALERFLELRPEKYEARYFLARCDEQLGRLEAAEREWALYHRAKGDG